MKTQSIAEFVKEQSDLLQNDLEKDLGRERAEALGLVGGGVLEAIALKIVIPIVVGFVKDMAIDAYKGWKTSKEVKATLDSVGSEPAIAHATPDKKALAEAMEEKLRAEGIPRDVSERVVRASIERVELKLKANES
jgi:hypothetical protein